MSSALADAEPVAGALLADALLAAALLAAVLLLVDSLLLDELHPVSASANAAGTAAVKANLLFTESPRDRTGTGQGVELA